MDALKIYRIRVEECKPGSVFYFPQVRKPFTRWKDLGGRFQSEKDAQEAAKKDFRAKPPRYKKYTP